MSSGAVEMRLVESQGIADGNSMNQPAYTCNRVPKESIDLGNGELGMSDLGDMISTMRTQDQHFF
jgi:hypothetical protein